MARIFSKPKFCAWHDKNATRLPWMVHQHITPIDWASASLEKISTYFQSKDVLTSRTLLPTSTYTLIIKLMGKPTL